jgi:hypothetical protein
MLRIHTTKPGYIWKSKLTGDILSETIYLGINDTIDNYEEVLIETPVEEKEIIE